MEQNPPQKPTNNVEKGVPVDKPYPPNPPQGPHGAYNPNMMQGMPAPAPQMPGQPAQVDQFGRPIVTAIPMQMTTQVVANNANIRRDAQGNALCNKCNAPYPLPPGTTSWR